MERLLQECSRNLEEQKQKEVEQMLAGMQLDKEAEQKQREARPTHLRSVSGAPGNSRLLLCGQERARVLATKQVETLTAQLKEAEDEKDQAERIGNDLAENQLRPMKDAVNYVRACGSSSIPSAGSTSPAPLPAARRWTRS